MTPFGTPAFLTGSPGPGEIIVIFLVVLVLFGPRKLPQIAREIGRILHDLRRASHDFRDQVMKIGEEPRRPIDVDEPDHEPSDEDDAKPDGPTAAS